MKKSITPLGLRREKLGYDQEQMAALLKTSQPEISRTENGDPPPTDEELKRWAKKYKTSKKRFKAECLAMRWELELWRFSECKTPAEIEHIDCTRKEVKTA